MKVPPWQGPDSAPVPPQGAPDSAGRPALRERRPAHWAPSHCLMHPATASSQPASHWTMQARRSPANSPTRAAHTLRCTRTGHGPSASMPASRPPRSPTPSTVPTSPPVRQACRLPSTWRRTEATTRTTSECRATWAWRELRWTRCSDMVRVGVGVGVGLGLGLGQGQG